MNVVRRSLPAAYLLSGLGFFLCTLPVYGGWKIMPHHFGRYTVPPRIYGYPLDDNHASYYGGSRYKEYYSFGRGGILADFPGPLPSASWFRYRQWPYSPNPEVYRPDAAPCAAQVIVHVPPGAEVWLEGRRMRSTGTQRTYVSPPLPRGSKHMYQVRARWPERGGIREQTREIVVQAGHSANIHFPGSTQLEVVPLPALQSQPQETSGNHRRQVGAP